MQFNINEIVRVRLTDHGRAMHKADHKIFWDSVGVLISPSYVPPKEDENGWSEWQLWSLMQSFGNHLSLGGKNCFETTIEIFEPKKEPTAKFKRFNNGGSGEFIAVEWKIPDADIPDEGYLLMMPKEKK